jgi:hypothetical protein
MRWCWLIGHKLVTGEWYQWPGGPDGWQTRTAKCPRCDKILYRQVRNSLHKLVYY